MAVRLEMKRSLVEAECRRRGAEIESAMARLLDDAGGQLDIAPRAMVPFMVVQASRPLQGRHREIFSARFDIWRESVSSSSAERIAQGRREMSCFANRAFRLTLPISIGGNIVPIVCAARTAAIVCARADRCNSGGRVECGVRTPQHKARGFHGPLTR